MALSSTTTRVSYNGDGTTSSFATVFKFLDNSHVEVVLRDANGVETTWVEGTQYTLTGAGNDNGGTAAVSASPTDYRPQTGERLVLRRVAPNTQESALPLGGAFPSTTVEEGLDLAAMRDQQLEEQIGRSLLLPVTSSSSDLTLPEPEASKVLGWNAAGTALENSTPNTGAYLSVSTFILTLLDDVSAAAARTTLGAQATIVTLPVANGGTNYTGGAWTAYTPVITADSGTFTTVSATGRYLQIGKLVFVEVDILITTNGTAAGSVVFSLPNSTTTAARYSLSGVEQAITGKQVVAVSVGAGSSNFPATFYDSTYPGGDGRRIIISGFYEAA